MKWSNGNVYLCPKWTKTRAQKKNNKHAHTRASTQNEIGEKWSNILPEKMFSTVISTSSIVVVSISNVCVRNARICVSSYDVCGQPNNENCAIALVTRKQRTTNTYKQHPAYRHPLHAPWTRRCNVCKLFLIQSHHLIPCVCVCVCWAIVAYSYDTVACMHRHVATVFLNIFIYSRISKHLRLKQ